MQEIAFKQSGILLLLISNFICELFVPALISLSLTACQNNLEAGVPAVKANSKQVIIKPNPGVNLSSGASSEFFKGYQAKIIYLREMSGQSHVVRIDSASVDAFQATLEQLNNDPRIEYAEPDLKMEIQLNQK